jgi:hypothetical protein
MTTATSSPPTAAPDRPRHVPARSWQLAVAFVQEHAKSFPCYWPLWCHVWRKHLRRIEDGARGDVFCRLFDHYESAGGRGSAFEPEPTAGPAVAADERAADETTSDTPDGCGPQTGQEGPPPPRSRFFLDKESRDSEPPVRSFPR